MHAYLYVDYFHRVAAIGVLFLVNAAFGLAIAVTVLLWRHVASLVAGLLYAAGTLAGFFASVAVGLFGFHERLRGPWQEAAGLVEATALMVFAVLIAAQLRHRSAARGSRQRPRTHV
jgi:hypothetical protein